MQQMQQPRQEAPPVSIQTALAYLSQCTEKTKNVVVGNGVSLEEFDGQELSGPELQAQTAACNLLTAYFVRHHEMVNEEMVRKCSPLAHAGLKPGDKHVMPCPACELMPGQPNCPFCRGKGEIEVYIAR